MIMNPGSELLHVHREWWTGVLYNWRKNETRFVRHNAENSTAFCDRVEKEQAWRDGYTLVAVFRGWLTDYSASAGND